MKKIKILYWVFTGLFSAFMLLTAIPDILVTPDAIDLIHTKLGYPVYLIAYLGVLKAAGAIIIIQPWFIRIKEWAYAGLLFDLVGAAYSLVAIGTPLSQASFMLLFILLGAVSYYFYYRMTKPVYQTAAL